MATIQKRKSRGHTYWYIVESRRVNGKPRPVTLAYLGRPEDLLLRLQGLKEFKVRSFSHGDTACLVQLADELQLVDIINRHVPAMPSGKRPIRDGLTLGDTLVLGAIGRACRPTSKRGWYSWARATSLEYSLRTTLHRVDSQHFWDQMDALPADRIPEIEKEIVEKVLTRWEIPLDCLFLDATNFFTFIDSTNHRCTIAQRGNSKQKRMDLRQFGLALIVTRQEQLPLFHCVYRGDKPDVTMFKEYFSRFRDRITDVARELESITLVFDRGNNSKANLASVDASDIHYVASMTPHHHRDLIKVANKQFEATELGDEEILTYRTQREIWGKKRTVVVLVSEILRQGQERGIFQSLEKVLASLQELKTMLDREKEGLQPRRKRTRGELESRVTTAISRQFIKTIISWKLTGTSGTGWKLSFWLNEKALLRLREEELGRRILITDRHLWSTQEIIRAYRCQSKVEHAFMTMKNPYHDAVRPQYHWTDQKIEVHVFMCVLSYLLASLAHKIAREKAGFTGKIATLMETLKTIRLATRIEKTGKKGKPSVTFALEEMDEEQNKLCQAYNITPATIRTKRKVGVYK
jgi:transposase